MILKILFFKLVHILFYILELWKQLKLWIHFHSLLVKHLFLQYILSIFVSSGVNKFQPVIGAMHHICLLTHVQ